MRCRTLRTFGRDRYPRAAGRLRTLPTALHAGNREGRADHGVRPGDHTTCDTTTNRQLEQDSNLRPPSHQLGALSAELCLTPPSLEPVRGTGAADHRGEATHAAGPGMSARSRPDVQPRMSCEQVWLRRNGSEDWIRTSTFAVLGRAPPANWATSEWSGRRVTLSSLGLGGAACSFHTPAAHLRTSVGLSKTPVFTAGGQQGIRTQSLRAGERVYGPPADHPHVPPVWRQRQDSNPDPRVLEARMLPLHHAADHVSEPPFDRHTLPET